MFDFLKIDDEFWDFPFYMGKPSMPKFGWIILTIVVLLEISLAFGVLGLLPIPLYLLPKEIMAILPCVIFLFALGLCLQRKIRFIF